MSALEGKIALITGASAGIGAAIARSFAAAGASLILGSRRLDVLEETASDIRKQFDTTIHAMSLDVRSRDSVTRFFDSIPYDQQDIDILVNNAGLARSLNPVYAMQPSDVDDMVDTNVKGLLNVTNHVVPIMLRRAEGHIINIGSTAGHDVYKGGVAYCATKHAVDVITRGLKIELHGTPIRVSTVDPGMVETDFSLVRFHGDAERAATVYADTRPLTAEDVAEAVLFCVTRPSRVNIAEIILTSVDQSSVTLVHRTPTKDS